LISRRAIGAGLIFALCLFAGLATGRQLFTGLTYLWGGLLVGSWVWSQLSLWGISFSRAPRSAGGQVGEIFEERFSLANRSRIPKLWIEIEDQSDLPGIWMSPGIMSVEGQIGRHRAGLRAGHRASQIVVGLGARRELHWRVRTRCSRRGRFRIGPIRLHSGDPFGLFRTSRSFPEWRHVVVLPMTEALDSVQAPAGFLPGGGAMRLRTHQVTPNAAGVRDYAAGDSLNRIHWRSTARRGRLIVKEFELDPKVDVWILMDACQQVQAQLPFDWQALHATRKRKEQAIELLPSTEEYAVAMAASFARHFLERERAVGLVAYGRSRHVSQAQSGEPQLCEILESLAVLEAQGSTRLEDVIRIESSRIPRGSSAILISPSTSGNLLAGAELLRQRGIQPLLALLDAQSFGGRSGTPDLAAAAERRGLAVRVVHYGDSLRTALKVGNGQPIPAAA
jgi:uncharacterized protein (DUF58 family)